MAHTRLRKFNTKDMYPEQALDNDVCMTVRAGNRVFLRGQTGFDLDGNFHGRGDPVAQAEMAMSCVKTLLGEVGATLEHICKTTVYITDRAYREPVYRVIGKCNGRRYSAPWVRYDHEASMLLTDAPVTVVDASGTLRGDGFRYYIDERRFELLGNVIVDHEP